MADWALRGLLDLAPVIKGGVGVSLSLVVAATGVFFDASDGEGDVARVITKLEVILVVPVVVVVVVRSVVVVSIETLDEALEVEAFDFDLDLGLEKPSASTSLAVVVVVVVVTVEGGEVEESLTHTLFPECPSPSLSWLSCSTLLSFPGAKSTLRA